MAEGSGGESVADKLKSLSLDKLTIENGTVILPASGDAKQQKHISAIMLEASLPSFDAALTFDARASFEGTPIHAVASIGHFGRFLEGAAAPVSIALDAPAYLPEKAILTGTATYLSEILTFAKFALSGQTLNLDALLAKPGAPQGDGGGATSAGWSDAKIDFSPLRAVNGKFKLTAKQLIYGNIELGNATINAALSGGNLSVGLPSFALYGGAGKLAANIDASGNTPSQKINLSLANFDAYPFLSDAAGFQSIEGKGTIALDIAMSGASQRTMVSALSGTAKLDFVDGAIRGINIAKTMRNLTAGIVTGWQTSGNEKTDFASLGASFKIAQGQAETKNLHLVGPLVRMAGAGNIDLPGRMLKMRVDPKLVASLEGQGGKTGLQELGVPIVIAGPWGAPKFYPDIAGILNDPVAAYQQLQNLGKGMVNLPGLDLGNTGVVGNVPAIIQDGKVNKDALKDSAIQGLGGLLLGKQKPGAQPPAEAVQPAPVPAAVTPNVEPTETNAKAKRKSKSTTAEAKAKAKKNKKKDSAQAASDSEEIDAEDAAKQLMQDLLGN